MTKKTTFARLRQHISKTGVKSAFLALSDLDKLNDTDNVLVDAALVCARLQIIKIESKVNDESHLIHEIESVLYETTREKQPAQQTRSRLNSNRISMSVGEVRSFFGGIKGFSPLAITSCVRT